MEAGLWVARGAFLVLAVGVFSCLTLKTVAQGTPASERAAQRNDSEAVASLASLHQ